jgi:hypothetical protein
MELSPALIATMLERPALAPPGGLNPAWRPTVHSQEQTWYYVSAALCSVVPGVFVVLRLYTKLYFVRKLSLPDCACTISLTLASYCPDIRPVLIVLSLVSHSWTFDFWPPLPDWTSLICSRPC